MASRLCDMLEQNSDPDVGEFVMAFEYLSGELLTLLDPPTS
jgi:hypothetical protein